MCRSISKFRTRPQVFFSDGGAENALKEGFEKEQIYVALDHNGCCVGFLWFILNGIFHSFPYLHMIAVKEEYRGQGIGKRLLQFFEDTCMAEYKKLFLVVADFNPEAKKLYQSIGYTEIGTIPNLYRAGITEYLMMKSSECSGGN